MRENKVENVALLAQGLGRAPHFAGIPLAGLERIVRSGRISHYGKDEVLFVEGEPGRGLYVLIEGQVQLCKLSPQGQIVILAIIEPVTMFNEVSALDEDACPDTAIALEDCRAWRLEPSELESLVLRHSQVGLGLLKVLAARNRTLMAQYEDLSFRSVLARTAKLLLELSAEGGTAIDRAKHPNTRLAARIATVPEAFSRSLKVFKENGDIVCDGAFIQVASPARLLEIAQMGPRGD